MGDFRLSDTKKLSTEITSLDAKEDALTAEITELTDALKSLNKAVEDNIKDREASKKANLKTIKDAKEGLGSVTEALNILTVFYKNAAKATVFVQASPVDEDTTGAGFAGAYSGKQSESTGIIGMLEVIKTDFERTIRVTTMTEAQDHADFIELDRALQSDISGKTTKKE